VPISRVPMAWLTSSVLSLAVCLDVIILYFTTTATTAESSLQLTRTNPLNHCLAR